MPHWLSGLLGLLLLLPTQVSAQGVGLWIRSDCTLVTGPITGQTWCFDSTAQTLKVWNGTAFVSITATPTITPPLTLTNAAGISGAANPFLNLAWTGHHTLKFYSQAPATFSTADTFTLDGGTAGLQLHLIQQAGGQRLVVWDSATTLPVIPHTGIMPTFAVFGDILIGDITTFSPAGNAWIVGNRTATGLNPATDITHHMSAKQVAGTETDGGAMIDLYPTDNAAGVTNDGIVELQAYGRGSAPLANVVLLSNRSAAGVVTRRWQMGGPGNVGDLVPFAANTYALGSSALPVKGLYLGAGTGTGKGQPGRWLDVDAAGGAGSAANTLENDLKTFSVPANTLATNGDTLHFIALFRLAANATLKQIRIRFGATVLIDSGGASSMSGQTIVVDGRVIRTGATAQVAYVAAVTDATNNGAWTTTMLGSTSFTVPAETLSGAVILKATSQQGVGAAVNDVIQDAFYVEYVTGT